MQDAAAFYQGGTAEQAVHIGDEGGVFGHIEVDVFVIAAADVEMVVIEEALEVSDGLLEALVPALPAIFFQASSAEEIFVGLAFAERMMAEFETGDEHAIDEERGSESGADGDGEFEAGAADGAVALHGSVVGDSGGDIEGLFELVLEIEADPFGIEIVRGQDLAALDYSGKAAGDAIEGSEGFGEGGEHGEDLRGFGGVGRLQANAFADGFAVHGDEQGFGSSAPDIEAENAGVFASG